MILKAFLWYQNFNLNLQSQLLSWVIRSRIPEIKKMNVILARSRLNSFKRLILQTIIDFHSLMGWLRLLGKLSWTFCPFIFSLNYLEVHQKFSNQLVNGCNQRREWRFSQNFGLIDLIDANKLLAIMNYLQPKFNRKN